MFSPNAKERESVRLFSQVQAELPLAISPYGKPGRPCGGGCHKQEHGVKACRVGVKVVDFIAVAVKYRHRTGLKMQEGRDDNEQCQGQSEKYA